MASDLSINAGASETEWVVVDQVVHGYSAGHRLLASSRRLTPKAGKLLSILSDLSGPMPPDGFEEYISIYPVAAEECVAIAKTWLANEMPRPGCVWTHTLLLSFEAAKRLESLTPLLARFARPSSRENFEEYSKPIRINNHQSLRVGPGERLPDSLLCERLVQFWYRSSAERSPVVLPATSSKEYEALLLSFWDQQIPKYRTTLAISSGSIADRILDKRSFDLQVVPTSSLREIVRRAHAVNLLDKGLLPQNSPEPEVDGRLLLARDLIIPASGLRTFLRAVANVETDRGEIPTFAAIYALFTLDESTKNKLDFIWAHVAAAYPQPASASGLKAFLFGGISAQKDQNWELAVLRRLLIDVHRVTFLDHQSLRITERCSELAESNTQAAIELFLAISVSSQTSDQGLLAAHAILQQLPTNTLIDLLESHPRFLSIALVARPNLVRNAGFWKVFHAHRFEIVVALASAKNVSSEDVSTTFNHIVTTFDWALLDTFIDRATDENLTELLNAAASDQTTPYELYEHTLRRRMPGVFVWCAGEPVLPNRLMHAVSNVVFPGWSGNQAFPFRAWNESLARLTENPDNEMRLYAFTLAMAFGWVSDHAGHFFRKSFGPVYRAARAEKLDYQCWALIEPYVPSLWAFSNWDQCERLRRAILEVIRKRQLNSRLLLEISQDSDSLRFLIKTAQAQGYQSLLDSLKVEATRTGNTLTDSQKSVILELI